MFLSWAARILPQDCLLATPLPITSATQSQAPSHPFPAPPALSGGCRGQEAKAQKLGCASDSLHFLTLLGPGIFFPGQRNVVRRERVGLRTYQVWAIGRSYDQGIVNTSACAFSRYNRPPQSPRHRRGACPISPITSPEKEPTPPRLPGFALRTSAVFHVTSTVATDENYNSK